MKTTKQTTKTTKLRHADTNTRSYTPQKKIRSWFYTQNHSSSKTSVSKVFHLDKSTANHEKIPEAGKVFSGSQKKSIHEAKIQNTVFWIHGHTGEVQRKTPSGGIASNFFEISSSSMSDTTLVSRSKLSLPRRLVFFDM